MQDIDSNNHNYIIATLSVHIPGKTAYNTHQFEVMITRIIIRLRPNSHDL